MKPGELMTRPTDNRPQHTEPPASSEADPRALDLLARLQAAQAGLARGPALAWERVFFAEAFAHPEPGKRVRAFLGPAAR